MTTTTTAKPPVVVQDFELIEYVHMLCTKLYGGTWSVTFYKHEGSWRARAYEPTSKIEYNGVALAGTARAALVALLREARREVDRRRQVLDELERALPKEAF